jgi:hypothetical protein
MIESRDELIMEFTDKYGYNHNNEDANDEDGDDGGDGTAPPAAVPPLVPTPLATAPEVIIFEVEDPVEIVPEQETPMVHDVILADPYLFNVLMRDYEESSSRMMDVLDDLDDLTEADYDVNEWFPKDGSNNRD